MLPHIWAHSVNISELPIRFYYWEGKGLSAQLAPISNLSYLQTNQTKVGFYMIIAVHIHPTLLLQITIHNFLGGGGVINPIPMVNLIRLKKKNIKT